MKFLASKKIAIILIMALTILALAGMIIPQVKPGESGYDLWKAGHANLAPAVEALQLNKIFTSIWIKVLFALFFVNLFTCVILQIKRLLTDKNNSPGPLYKEIKTAGDKNPAVLIFRYLKAKRYKAFRETDAVGNETISGKKYSFSRWAVVIFHIGLLVVILGILISSLAVSDGIIPIMEGQQVTESASNYVLLDKGMLAGGHTDLPIKMKKISMEFDKKTNMINSVIEDIDFGDGTFQLDSKNPVSSRGFTIYRDKDGYTLTVSITGKSRTAADITFPLLMDPLKHNVYVNEVNLPGTPFILSATLYPNAVKTGKGIAYQPYYSNGNALFNPFINIVVKDNGGKEVKNVYLKNGTGMEFDGSRLQVKEIGSWCSLRLVRDPGVNVIYLGFFISIMALGMMYLLIPREIHLKIKNSNTVEISGKISHYRNLFKDELEDVAVFLTEGGGNQ